MKRKINFKIFFIILLLAIFTSIYLIYLHYAPSRHESFCNIADSNFSCDIVYKGEFSTLDGIINHLFKLNLYFPLSNAIMSLVFFTLVLVGTFLVYKNRKFLSLSPVKMLKIIRILLILSLFYAIFLVYLEMYVIFAWCIVCMALDILIILSLVFSFLIKK